MPGIGITILMLISILSFNANLQNTVPLLSGCLQSRCLGEAIRRCIWRHTLTVYVIPYTFEIQTRSILFWYLCYFDSVLYLYIYILCFFYFLLYVSQCPSYMSQFFAHFQHIFCILLYSSFDKAVVTNVTYN